MLRLILVLSFYQNGVSCLVFRVKHETVWGDVLCVCGSTSALVGWCHALLSISCDEDIRESDNFGTLLFHFCRATGKCQSLSTQTRRTCSIRGGRASPLWYRRPRFLNSKLVRMICSFSLDSFNIREESSSLIPCHLRPTSPPPAVLRKADGSLVWEERENRTVLPDRGRHLLLLLPEF